MTMSGSEPADGAAASDHTRRVDDAVEWKMAAVGPSARITMAAERVGLDDGEPDAAERETGRFDSGRSAVPTGNDVDLMIALREKMKRATWDTDYHATLDRAARAALEECADETDVLDDFFDPEKAERFREGAFLAADTGIHMFPGPDESPARRTRTGAHRGDAPSQFESGRCTENSCAPSPCDPSSIPVMPEESVDLAGIEVMRNVALSDPTISTGVALDLIDVPRLPFADCPAGSLGIVVWLLQDPSPEQNYLFEYLGTLTGNLVHFVIVIRGLTTSWHFMEDPRQSRTHQPMQGGSYVFSYDRLRYFEKTGRKFEVTRRVRPKSDFATSVSRLHIHSFATLVSNSKHVFDTVGSPIASLLELLPGRFLSCQSDHETCTAAADHDRKARDGLDRVGRPSSLGTVCRGGASGPESPFPPPVLFWSREPGFDEVGLEMLAVFRNGGEVQPLSNHPRIFRTSTDMTVDEERQPDTSRIADDDPREDHHAIWHTRNMTEPSVANHFDVVAVNLSMRTDEVELTRRRFDESDASLPVDITAAVVMMRLVRAENPPTKEPREVDSVTSPADRESDADKFPLGPTQVGASRAGESPTQHDVDSPRRGGGEPGLAHGEVSEDANSPCRRA